MTDRGFSPIYNAQIYNVHSLCNCIDTHNCRTLITLLGFTVCICLFFALMPASPAHASEGPTLASNVGAEQVSAPKVPPADENSKMEVVWELDPYYTDIDVNIPLTGKPIPTITSDSEAVIYRDLIAGSAIPRYMLLEASIYPMPILGTYMKKHTAGFYKQGQIGNSGINIFDSATAGFQEPWAVSAFFGNIAKLERPGEKRSGSNMGYTGYLISGGVKHIKNNVLISDDWYELEWKVKGKLNYPNEKMNWSFRVGLTYHSNPDITDVKYFNIHRSNLDHREPFLRWLKNSAFDLKVQLSQHGSHMVRSEFIFGKKYPIAGKSYSPTLDIGLVWESPQEYAGSLRDRSNSTLTLLFRPSIEF